MRAKWHGVIRTKKYEEYNFTDWHACHRVLRLAKQVKSKDLDIRGWVVELSDGTAILIKNINPQGPNPQKSYLDVDTAIAAARLKEGV